MGQYGEGAPNAQDTRENFHAILSRNLQYNCIFQADSYVTSFVVGKIQHKPGRSHKLRERTTQKRPTNTAPSLSQKQIYRKDDRPTNIS